MQRYKRKFFRETLAWARIDLGSQTNEALIEELQTDWLRRAKRMLKDQETGVPVNDYYGIKTTPEKMQAYLTHVLACYQSIWDEALLTATLQLIFTELGIYTAYMHTPETGAVVKRIQGLQPPRSLYSKLPRKFCFNQTQVAPKFLRKNKEFCRFEKNCGLPNGMFLV